MTFFHVISTFSIFFLGFYFPFLSGLLFPFPLWTFISLLYLDFFSHFLFVLLFVFNSFSIRFQFYRGHSSWILLSFFSFKFTGHTVVEKVFQVSQCFSSLLFTSTNLLKEIQSKFFSLTNYIFYQGIIHIHAISSFKDH